MQVTARWRGWARRLAVETRALGLACRDPRVPWYAKAVAFSVVAYAFSPLDLIPDVIPVIGYLDDLVLVPIGIAVAIRLIPAEVLAECRTRATAAPAANGRMRWAGLALVVGAWIIAAALTAAIVYRVLRQG